MLHLAWFVQRAAEKLQLPAQKVNVISGWNRFGISGVLQARIICDRLSVLAQSCRSRARKKSTTARTMSSYTQVPHKVFCSVQHITSVVVVMPGQLPVAVKIFQICLRTLRFTVETLVCVLYSVSFCLSVATELLVSSFQHSNLSSFVLSSLGCLSVPSTSANLIRRSAVILLQWTMSLRSLTLRHTFNEPCAGWCKVPHALLGRVMILSSLDPSPVFATGPEYCW